MKQNNVKIIACATVIEEMMPLLPEDIETIKIESGLHVHADKLKGALQDKIDEITSEAETIVLGYGLCSLAAIGLKAPYSTLVVPRADDCIAMFLGSQEVYKSHLKEEPGTYFLSKGWIDAGVTLVEEYKQTEERLGKRAAEIVKKEMFGRYTRLAFIDMGHCRQSRYQKFARQAAEEFNLRYEELKGTTKLIEKLCNGPWDDDFIVAPPGRAITLADFRQD